MDREDDPDDILPDGYFSDGYVTKAKIFAAIKDANNASDLMDTFRRYGLRFEQIHQGEKGWTHRTNCPLPSHEDSTPSFGYNSKEDRFYCFGCKESGRTVEFIHLMDGRSKYLIAQEILSAGSTITKIPVKVMQHEEINKLLVSTSKMMHGWLGSQPSKKKIKYLDAVAWSLEAYLLAKIGKDIDSSSLEKRIELIERYLAVFQENN